MTCCTLPYYCCPSQDRPGTSTWKPSKRLLTEGKRNGRHEDRGRVCVGPRCRGPCWLRRPLWLSRAQGCVVQADLRRVSVNAGQRDNAEDGEERDGSLCAAQASCVDLAR